MPDYDFYHGLYSGQQVDSAVARALVGGQLDQDIAAIRAAVGSPLVANAASEMTNINKIYVYTGSEAGYSTGHWYYYEGGSWQDGGLYNSAAADDEMSDSSTNAVQNKVIKAYVDTTASGLSGDIGDVRTDLGTAIYAEQTRAEGVEALKAPLASPTLTGTPTAPTAAAGTANTQIATTAYADNAVAAEKARAEAVEATKADQSFAEYILLREEEDRQILFGSIVEAAEDEYSELRSAPLHNAITIGGSVYPRMDRTRMAIDAIKGRTVAFNQLVTNGNFPNTTGWTAASASISASSNVLTMTTTGIGYCETSVGDIINGHKYLFAATINTNSTNMNAGLYKSGTAISGMYQSGNWSASGRVVRYSVWSASSTYTSATVRVRHNAASASSTTIENVMLIDLTAMYGTTLADSIYAMEQATTGAGVAYVRQRLDLDYYAYNAGELTAPVVSGVGFVGFNLWDEEWEEGYYVPQSGLPASSNQYIRSKNYIRVLPITNYFFKKHADGDETVIIWYDASHNYVGYTGISGNSQTFTIPSDACYMKFYVKNSTYHNDICINLSNPSRNGEYQPYQHTALSIPSTRLDGVGTAQDYIEVVEDGENDYSLHLHKVMERVNLGDIGWNRSTSYANPFFYGVVSHKEIVAITCLCEKYVSLENSPANAFGNNAPNLSVALQATGNQVYIRDDNYTDKDAFRLSLANIYLVYELATPTETVIAEHLTLADISAIAQNGGIISVENSNGHIVQPDVVADVVISRSAS